MTLLKPPKDTGCSCSSGKQKCLKYPIRAQRNVRVVDSGDVVFDMTGRDLNDYLLRTTDTFTRHRLVPSL